MPLECFIEWKKNGNCHRKICIKIEEQEIREKNFTLENRTVLLLVTNGRNKDFY